MVKKAIELLAQRKNAGIDTQIFVKISPDSIQDGSLLGLLQTTTPTANSGMIQSRMRS